MGYIDVFGKVSMKASRIAVVVSLVFAASLSLHGKKREPVQHAPLPAKLLAAKSIYIQNDSGQADLADKSYTELKTWGRYQIVDAKDKAIVILVFSVTMEETRKTSVSHSSSYNTNRCLDAWNHDRSRQNDLAFFTGCAV